MSESIFGPMVMVVRTPVDGDPVRQWLPVAVAVADLGWNEDNGVEWASARIVAFDVDLGAWDRSA